uniref:NAD-dependent epimerase/dehydratase family protein n=1 Tax=Desulfacinum infernum TaxID=35837 RepID=A0A832A4L1_9BACT
MRCVVTGGAGFIGSELVRQLSARGDEVTVVDNLVNGKKENLDGLPSGTVRLVVADIRDREAVLPLLDDVDILFHLACLGVRHALHSPMENHDVNATATLRLLDWARVRKVRKFVYVSTSEVYGTARRVPMAEDHPTYPHTVYGASKLAGDCYTRAYYETYRYPTVVVRPFNTYGPRCHHEGDSGEVIPKFMLRTMAGRPMVVFGDGNQTRDFTYVEDTARGILLAGLSDQAVGKTLNLGSGQDIAIKDLASKVAECFGLDRPHIIYEEPRPGDVARLCAGTARAWELLRFEVRVSLEEGLRRLKAWYESRGQSPEELLKQEIVRNWEIQGV